MFDFNAQEPNLSKETAKFVEELKLKNAPPLYKLSPDEARKVLDNLQAQTPVEIEADVIDENIFTEIADNIDIRIVRPKNSDEKLPVIIYLHGGGWILGNRETHDALIKKLADCTNSVVIFPLYSLAPEAAYPIALTQTYAVLDYVFNNPEEFNIDENKIAIAGDSAGGNMAIVTALRVAKNNNAPRILFQSIFYPVTDASMNTDSYKKFENGPWLTKKAMEWFWEAYAPDKNLRTNPYISPINASKEDLQNLPPSLIITAENDVLRDEGEIFAQKLDEAGVKTVNIRVNGAIHDFLMLNTLQNTPQAQVAFNIACQMLKSALHS